MLQQALHRAPGVLRNACKTLSVGTLRSRNRRVRPRRNVGGQGNQFHRGEWPGSQRPRGPSATSASPSANPVGASSDETPRQPNLPHRRRVLLGLSAALVAAIAISPAGGAIARTCSRSSTPSVQLDEADQHEGVLSTDIARYSDRIDQVAGEVAVLRNREAEVQAQLDEVKAPARAGTAPPRGAARASLARWACCASLVAIYKSDEPDALTVILNSDGFDDLLDRYEYLRRIEEQDASIVDASADCATRPGTPWSASRPPAMRSRRARQSSSARGWSWRHAKPSSTPSGTESRGARPGSHHAGAPGGRHRRSRGANPGSAPGGSGGDDDAAAGQADPGRERFRLHLARQRPGRLALRHALGQAARGHRHRGSGRDPDSSGEGQLDRLPLRTAATGTTPASTTAAGSRRATRTSRASPSHRARSARGR